MATKHTPTIELDAARRELDAARNDCPHWDYESDDDGEPYDCCYRVDDARRRLRRAREAVQESGL